MRSIIRIILIVIGIGIVLFLLIQLIPLDRTNPPVVTQIKWDSPTTEALFNRACADCHSNYTTWPWYSYIAPVDWLIVRDVHEGRQRFNVSNLNQIGGGEFGGEGGFAGGRDTNRIARDIDSGRMPPWYYLIMHPNGNLTAAEKQQLGQGLQTTLANNP